MIGWIFVDATRGSAAGVSVSQGVRPRVRAVQCPWLAVVANPRSQPTDEDIPGDVDGDVDVDVDVASRRRGEVRGSWGRGGRSSAGRCHLYVAQLDSQLARGSASGAAGNGSG